MTRVKIKCKNSDEKRKKTKLLEILCTKQVQVTKVFTTPDGYGILLINEDHADKIFTREIKEELVANGFSAVLPPELKSKKSVIISRADDVVYDKTVDVIADELTQNNAWIGDDTDSVFKFPNSNTLKVTFNQTATAKKCTENGLLAFNLSIPPSDIKQETFIPIKTCMKCYTLEDHTTKDCPEEKDFKICSECSLVGHAWHQCTAKRKKCINCGDEHSTLAMRCPKRKEIIKMKRKQERDRSSVTYANVAKTNTTSDTHRPATTTSEDMLRINTCILHAHYRNIENPGTYEAELNKVLKLNNLPTIRIPENPDSHKILNIPKPPPTAATRKDKTSHLPQCSREDEIQVRDDDVVESPEETEKEFLPTCTANEFELNFYVSEERGWPKTRFTVTDLVNGINNKIYKWTYTNQSIPEHEMLKMIGDNKVRLKHCWKALEISEFRKLRSGLLQERSPAQNRDPRLRKTSLN